MQIRAPLTICFFRKGSFCRMSVGRNAQFCSECWKVCVYSSFQRASSLIYPSSETAPREPQPAGGGGRGRDTLSRTKVTCREEEGEEGERENGRKKIVKGGERGVMWVEGISRLSARHRGSVPAVLSTSTSTLSSLLLPVCLQHWTQMLFLPRLLRASR